MPARVARADAVATAGSRILRGVRVLQMWIGGLYEVSCGDVMAVVDGYLGFPFWMLLRMCTCL